MQAVRPAPHEFAANLVFDEHGLKPYFAADAVRKEAGGSKRGTFEIDGERWEAKLYYQESGLLPPSGNRTPAGTPWELDDVIEFRIHVSALGDDIGQRKFNAHIAPRWQGMMAEKNDGSTTGVSVPEEIEEGINVSVKGANIEFDRYHELLQAAAEAVGINRWYFDNPHPFSNVQDAARYVRIHTDRSGPIHARDGPIAQIAHLLENDRSGSRKIEQTDDDEHGRNIPGYRHMVTVGPRRVREALPDHDFPRRVKHYYAREALSFSKGHPLRHPKLEISYRASEWDEKLDIDEIGELTDQLDQTLYSVLADSGLQVHDGPDAPFFPDEYFEPENVDRPESWLYDMDLTAIEHDQESIVLKYLADGFSPVEWESLTTLVTDGGELAPADIADQHDRHPDSVRRALRRMEELLDREYGRVALGSPFIAELIHKKLSIAREAARDAAEATAKIAYAAERELDENTSAFIAWAASVGIDVDDRQDARLRFRLGDFKSGHSLGYELARAFDLWCNAGRDPFDFRRASVTVDGHHKGRAGDLMRPFR